MNVQLINPPVLAQVNFGGGLMPILGIAIMCAGAGLFLLRSIRPNLAKDYDIVISAIALLSGVILVWQGWRMDPLLQFNQLLTLGCTVFFAIEGIRLRGVTNEQARRNSPLVDDERSVSQVYRYEADLDDYDAFDDPRRNRRRIRGTEPRRGYDDEYMDEPRRERPARRPPRASLREAEAPRGRGDFDEFDQRPPSRPASGPSSGRPPRGDDWDDAGRRGRDIPPGEMPPRDIPPRDLPPRDRRGPRPTRDLEVRPSQEDMPPPRRRPRGGAVPGSMEGSPIPPNFAERPPEAPDAAPPDSRGPSNPPGFSDSGRDPGRDRPPLRRPPQDQGSRRRPDPEASDRPPFDRPPLDPPPSDRPPLERPPLDPPPGRPLDASNPDDNYVDFKPLTPPPEDEMDNSSQFDD